MSSQINPHLPLLSVKLLPFLYFTSFNVWKGGESKVGSHKWSDIIVLGIKEGQLVCVQFSKWISLLTDGLTIRISPSQTAGLGQAVYTPVVTGIKVQEQLSQLWPTIVLTATASVSGNNASVSTPEKCLKGVQKKEVPTVSFFCNFLFWAYPIWSVKFSQKG